MRKIKGVFAFFLLASQLCGQNYYVAPPPVGNDGNSGLSGAPWATLQYAVNRLAAGDVLTVEDGTYTGFYMDRIKGTAAQRITITARNRLGAVINAPPSGRTRNCEFLSCSYITFDGFEVTLAPAGGIVFRTYEYEYTGVNCRDNIVQYCHSHHNSVGDPTGSHDGIFTGFALNFTAQYNTVHDNGEHGIYVSNSADNPVVRGNVIYGNFNNGLHMNSDLTSGGDGIITNWLVEDNIIYDNGRTGINLDGDSNGVCRNNLLYNNRAGIALYQIDGAQGACDNLIVNNTIYTYIAPTTPNTGSLRAAINVMDGSNNNVIFNNIIYAVGATGATPAFDVGAVTGLLHDYNIVGRFGNSTPAFGGTTASAHETSPDPSAIFTDIAGADFTLIAGCGAVDTGTGNYGGFAAPLNDILSATRPQSAGFDMGCYERQAQGS
ncbi:MAG TPA: right-handed parallel beta-helix repeat-containing protein, partial [Candidatus Goldiibacteriota bacterium]|nr:right-handed parallel beta-helix repeat-containing protein [Candidatus Goldiibacteriota bacterium]